MYLQLDFEGNHEIGAYVVLTNKYIIVGRSQSQNVIDFFRTHFECPIVETTINSIRTVGAQCVGNSRGLILPDTCTDQELQHIRNSLPKEIQVVRIRDKLNALGNIICCNDHACLVHPDLEDENVAIISKVLGVDVYKQPVGSESLVGTYSVLNNQGMLTHPNISECQMSELARLMKVQVIAGTVNSGNKAVGSGMVANDWVCILGNRCTNVEIKVAETVFNLTADGFSEKAAVEEIVQ
jgi:translation initiation factor 6